MRYPSAQRSFQPSCVYEEEDTCVSYEECVFAACLHVSHHHI
jgi:hypothetical protein